jgi:Holliday junction DNA helicase RuvB
MVPLSDVRQALEAAGLVPGLPLAEIHARLEAGLRLHDTGQRVLAFYLNEMDVGRLHQASGHGSTAHYAEARLGIDRRRTSELIAVGKKLLTLELVDHAFCRQEIGWSKVLLLVGVATPEHQEAWLDRARKLSCRALALEVRLSKPGSPPRPPGERKGLPEIRFRFDADVGTLTYGKLERAKQKLSAESGRSVTDAEFLDVMADLFLQLEEDGSVPGRTRVSSSLYRIVLRPEAGGGLVMDSEVGPLPVADGEPILCDGEVVPAADAPTSPGDLDSKTPPALRRRVLARDGYRCRCCGSRQRLMVHHVRFRSHGGATRMSNLVTLCVRCHALVHDGLLVLVGDDAATLRFEDATKRPVNEGAAPPEAGTALALAPPLPHAQPIPTTLAAIPDVVDGSWWRRHAHLVRFGSKGLELEEGVPLPDGEADACEPAPSDGSTRDAFSAIVGQDGLLHRFESAARGSRARGRAFPHTLLTGPAGTGKTTVAHALAASLGRRLVKAVGPLLQDVHVLVRLLADLREGDVLFVEEVHAAPRPVLEALYEAMAEQRLSLTLHSGARARALRFALPAFTLVAATTEGGDLPTPLLGRFGLRESLGYYPKEVLSGLVTREARKSGVTLEARASARLADFARGTPREALRLLDRVLDEAAGRDTAHLGESAVTACLTRLGYDALGLEPLEQRYVSLLRRSLAPVPIARLARVLGASVRTLLRDVEPILFRMGLLEVTPRGRTAVSRPRLLEA